MSEHESPAIVRLSESLAKMSKIAGELAVVGAPDPAAFAEMVRSLTAISVRLQCVEVAAGTWRGSTAEETAGAARVLADFVLGTGDAEIIDAARTFAKKVG